MTVAARVGEPILLENQSCPGAASRLLLTRTAGPSLAFRGARAAVLRALVSKRMGVYALRWSVATRDVLGTADMRRPSAVVKSSGRLLLTRYRGGATLWAGTGRRARALFRADSYRYAARWPALKVGWHTSMVQVPRLSNICSSMDAVRFRTRYLVGNPVGKGATLSMQPLRWRNDPWEQTATPV